MSITFTTSTLTARLARENASVLTEPATSAPPAKSISASSTAKPTGALSFIREIIHWLALAMFLGYALNMNAKETHPTEKEFNRKALLIVKDCGDKQLCVQPLYPPRLVVLVKTGEAPKKGQVLKCSRADNGDLLCEHGLRLKPDSILLQAQEEQ